MVFFEHMKITNRLDQSMFSPEERDALPNLAGLLNSEAHLSLTGGDGAEIRLPKPIFELLLQVIDKMNDGKAIVLMPEDETFTTQAAANFLGMSRQHFVTLLESGEVPFHRVGSHRRVTFKDLRDYTEKRNLNRKQKMRSLFQRLQDEGVYDADYTGEHES